MDGSTFDIYVLGDRVEAIRINAEYRPQIAKIARRAELAIEQVTGCPVTRIHGDVALLEAEINCNKPVVAGEWARFAKPKQDVLHCRKTHGAAWRDWDMVCS